MSTTPVQRYFPSPTAREFIPLSASRLTGMAAAALCGNDLPGVVLEKEKEFLLNGHRALKVVDKSLWIRFVVISHRRPLPQETVRFGSRCHRLL